MSAFLSPVFGAGMQLFTNAGVVLAGGKITTYLAGSTTAQATWTDSTQVTQNANPVILDSAGRSSTEIWLANGVTYKFVLSDSSNNVLGTYDNIVGINVTTFSQSQWVTSSLVITYVSTTSFSVPGNQTSLFPANTRVQYVLGSGTFYGYVSASSYNGTTTTTVTVVPDATNLDNTISAVNYGLITATNTSIPQQYQIAAADKVPSRTGNSGKILGNDGTTSAWQVLNVAGDHSVVLTTGNGYGAVNTCIRRFTTTQSSSGTAITYADSANNGASFTINSAGFYQIYYLDAASGGLTFSGVSLNSAQLTTAVSSITAANRISMASQLGSNQPGGVTVTVLLAVNDVIRAHTNGAGTDSTSAVNTVFAIRRVGVAT